MTSVIPPVVCPSWCVGCDEGGGDTDGRRTVSHNGADITIPHSRGRVEDHFDDITVYLSGTNGSAPFIAMARDDQWSELTTEEAEHLAGSLTSLVSQARAAEPRY